MTLNYIKVCFSFMILFIIVTGSLINSFEKYLPVFIKQSFRYGKFAYNGKQSRALNLLNIPKSWCRHFYIYASLLTTSTLWLLIYVYVFNRSVPDFVLHYLDYICEYRTPTASVASVILAVVLLTVQCLRRFYDTQYVCVYAKNSKINWSHYIVGFVHYTGAVLAILVEAPKFADGNYKKFQWSDLTYVDGIASLLFLWAWWHQWNVNVILANLRKNEKGLIVTDSYKLPQGDWFEYVSSPHLLTEILMYVALTIILWFNTTWWYIFVWVLSNQVETALLSHWWYQETFIDLPKHRKAIIPFIY